MVKDHSDSEIGNPLSPHGVLFPIRSKGSFICTIPQTVSHMPRPLLHQSWSTGWNEKQLNGSSMKDRSDDPSHMRGRSYHGATSRSCLKSKVTVCLFVCVWFLSRACTPGHVYVYHYCYSRGSDKNSNSDINKELCRCLMCCLLLFIQIFVY